MNAVKCMAGSRAGQSHLRGLQKPARRLSLSALAFAALVAACRHDTPDTRQADVVLPGDSVVIQEPDSLALGRRTPLLLRAADGRMVLAEFPGKAVYAYAADGSFLGMFGRPGEGPGELRLLTGMGLLPGDSLLAVVDFLRSRLIIYRMDDRTLVRELPLTESLMPVVGWADAGEVAILPMSISPTPFNALNTTTGEIQPWGKVPERWPEINRASGYARPVAVPVGERVLTALPFDPMVEWRDRHGSVLTTEPLPRLHRRGEPPDAVKRIRDWQDREEKTLQGFASGLLAGHRFSGDRVGLLHADLDAVQDDSDVGSAITSSALYLTILPSGTTRGCTDLRLPIAFTEYSWPTFTGDTIWFLDRTPAADGSAKTMVRGLVVRGSNCD